VADGGGGGAGHSEPTVKSSTVEPVPVSFVSRAAAPRPRVAKTSQILQWLTLPPGSPLG
jgi:hypothetical protein